MQENISLTVFFENNDESGNFLDKHLFYLSILGENKKIKCYFNDNLKDDFLNYLNCYIKIIGKLRKGDVFYVESICKI